MNLVMPDALGSTNSDETTRIFELLAHMTSNFMFKTRGSKVTSQSLQELTAACPNGRLFNRRSQRINSA
jgi:hypothetical protein